MDREAPTEWELWLLSTSRFSFALAFGPPNWSCCQKLSEFSPFVHTGFSQAAVGQYLDSFTFNCSSRSTASFMSCGWPPSVDSS
jgi:hypothetical protein